MSSFFFVSVQLEEVIVSGSLLARDLSTDAIAFGVDVAWYWHLTARKLKVERLEMAVNYARETMFVHHHV